MITFLKVITGLVILPFFLLTWIGMFFWALGLTAYDRLLDAEEYDQE